MTLRSALAEVRNPVLALPEAQAILALPLESRAAIRALPLGISRHARERAQKSWLTHKAPMALYWKVVAVWAGHIARAIR